MFKNGRKNMKIKRLIAGGIAAAAIGATLIAGGLAATTFDKGMGEFVTISGGALTSPVIVVGAGVDTTDVLGAADIAASLVSNYAVTAKTIPSAGAATSVTNGVLVDSSLNKTYLSAKLGTVKSVITETHLPEILTTGTFTDMNATTSTYTQKITLNAGSTGTGPTFGVPSGDTEPYLNVPITTTITPYNLTITFIGGLDPTAVDSTYGFKLFGKDYTFGNIHNNITLELYSSAGAQVLDLSGAGDEKTVTVGSQTFTIKLNGWNSAGTTAYLSVNGVSYTWNEAGTYTVSGTKFYVQSVDVIYTGAQEATGMVKLFVGTDKLYLLDKQQIQKNDVTKNSYVYFSSPSVAKINSITFEVLPDDDFIVKEGAAFTDPVFGSFKTVLSGMTPAFEDSSRDLIKIASDNTNTKLSFKNKDGMQYTNIPIAYHNSTNSYAQINNVNYFHTQECNVSLGVNNITKGDYFVLTNSQYSYIMKYTNYNYDTSDSTKTYVTLTDLATSANYKIYPNTGERLTIGSLAFSVQWNGNTLKTICVDLNGNAAYSNLTTVNITTGGRAQIQLAKGTGGIGAQTGSPSYANVTYISEVPLYVLANANDGVNTTTTIVSTYSSTTGVRLTTTNAGVAPLQVGTANEWKYVSSYGSYLRVIGDTNGANSVSIYNAGERPSPANIAIGTNPVISTMAGAAGGTYNEAVPVTNPIAKFPSEVTQTASLDKDLILVGGPCANALVKTLLNTAWNSTDSCAAWLADADLKDNGKGLIQVVEDIFGSGKKALIVAGTSAQDTRNLIANKVIKPTEFKGLGAVAQYKGAA
jgi:hypothetical protein